ncbi:MAG: PilZ domain-containing protein [Nitrospirota bacterium]
MRIIFHGDSGAQKIELYYRYLFISKEQNCAGSPPCQMKTLTSYELTVMARGRRHKRVSIKGMDIYAKTTFDTRVEILDISTQGVCIKSARRLVPGCKCILNLKNKGSFLPLKGTVRWERFSGKILKVSGEVETLYRAGVEFEYNFSEFSGYLKYMGEYCETDEKKLRGTRYQIPGRETALLNYEETFNVSSLSAGGLLVESLNKIEFDRKMTMELHLPKENHTIKFQGRVASCVPVKNKKPERYNIGIEFLDIEETDRSRLKKLVQLLSGL